MKYFLGFSLVLLLAVFTAIPASAQTACAKIKDGSITDSAGVPLTLGFDKYGYNYQAHMFNGLYDNYTRPAVVVAEGAENLVMKWSDDWLSNLDCYDVAGKLDRGGASSVSKGWTTNHIEGDYEDVNGIHHYTYFVKIIWVDVAPAGDDPWAGKRIWGQYAVIEEVYNDPDGGLHGVDRSKLVNPAGLGFWTN